MRYFALLAGTVLLGACSDATAPASRFHGLATPTSATNDLDLNQTVPSALAAVNPCNGEPVALIGSTHFLIHSTEARSGNYHFYIDIRSTYSGPGVVTQVKYQGTAVDVTDVTTNNPFPIVESLYNEVTLRSATSVLNWTLRLHFKVTFNATGVPTAEMVDYTARCGG
jgi:hypothetical protein